MTCRWSRAAAVATTLACAAPAAAQIDRGWFGEWHLNLAKSTYDPGPAPYRRARFRIEPFETNGLHVVYDMVRPRGGVAHLEWTGRLDGTDYPVHGVEEVVTYAYRIVDARTFEVVTKLDGRETARSRTVLEPDGAAIRTTTTGRDAQGSPVTTVTVYERRSTPVHP